MHWYMDSIIYTLNYWDLFRGRRLEDGRGELGDRSTDVVSQHLCFPSRKSMDLYTYAGVAIETTLKNVQAFIVNKKGVIEIVCQQLFTSG